MRKFNEKTEEADLISKNAISRISNYSFHIRTILLVNSLLLLLAVTASFMISSGLGPHKNKHSKHHDNNHENLDVNLKYTFNESNGGHTYVVQKIATIGNTLLGSAGYDGTIKVWNINNGTLRFTFNISDQAAYTNTVAGIGKNLLASASWDYAIRIWDVNNGTLKYVFNKTNGGHIYYVWVLVPIGTDLLASGGGEGWVKIWDLKNGVLKYTFGRFDNKQVRDLAVMSNILASGGDDANVKLWDYSNGSLIIQFNDTNGGHSSPVTTLARLNNHLLASGAQDGSLRIWDVNARVLFNSFDYNNGAHSSGITALAWIGNNLFASGASDGEIKVWDLNSIGMLKYTFDWTTNSHKDIINSLTSLADGELLISGSMDITIKVWDMKNGTLIKTLDSTNGGHRWFVETVVQVARNIFASCANDFDIKVWQLYN